MTKPLSVQEFDDNDYIPDFVNENYKKYLITINNIILANKLKKEKILKHRYVCYVNDESMINMSYIFLYISKLFENQGWIVNLELPSNSNRKIVIEILHPKSIFLNDTHD